MKAVINSVTPKVWQDKKFQEVVFNGNQTGASWADDFMPVVGQTVEIEVKVTSKGKNSLSLVGGSMSPVETPRQNTSPVPAISQSTDADLRVKALYIVIEKDKASGKTIEHSSFWVDVVDMVNFIKDGTTPSPKQTGVV
jgi:hypothetical protein